MYDVMCCTLTLSKLRQGRLAQSGCDESERRTAAPPCPFMTHEQRPCLTHPSASSLARANNTSISRIENVVKYHRLFIRLVILTPWLSLGQCSVR